VFFDMKASRFSEVGDQGGAQADHSVVADNNQVRVRRLENTVIADPHPLTQLDTAPSVQERTQRCGTWYAARQFLKPTVT